MDLRMILNGLLFEIGWLGAVLAAARGSVLLATLAPLAVAAIHLWQIADRATALRLMAVAAAIGIFGETILLALKLSGYAAHWPSTATPPIWVVALWLAFATLSLVAMRWFREHLVLTAVLGAIFGPLTYRGGAELGAGYISSPMWPILVGTGILWAIAAPLLLWLAVRWEHTQAA